MTRQSIASYPRTFRSAFATTMIRVVLSSLTPRRAFLIWFLIGTASAAILQLGQARVMGGVPEGLLFAGTWQEVHPLVVEQLPRTPVFEGFGHDGQIFYAVGLDLRGEWVPDILKSAPYRYRRILYPALASGFGSMDGSALLWGMILLAALPVGLAAGAVGAIVTHPSFGSGSRIVGWAPLAVVLNPSSWLSSRLLTADNLVLAFGLLGVLAFLRRKDTWAILALAAAALTKEPSIAFAAGLAVFAWFQRERLRALRIALGAGLPMLAWWAYVAVAVGNPLDSGGNVVAPFAGILKSIPVWTDQRPRDWLYLTVVLFGCAASVWVVVRGKRLWASLVAPQLLIALMSSHLVWHLGNNAVRAFGPLLTLACLGLLAGSRRATAAETTPVGASP